MLVCRNGGYGRFRFIGCSVVGLRKEISTVVGVLHFGGRRSALCRGSEEVDLYWFVGIVGFDWGIVGMVSLPWVWMLGELVEEELWVMGADRWSSCVNCGERDGSVYIGFRVLEKLLHFYLFIYLFWLGLKKKLDYFFFFNIMLIWKIVGDIYIYIYRLCSMYFKFWHYDDKY